MVALAVRRHISSTEKNGGGPAAGTAQRAAPGDTVGRLASTTLRPGPLVISWHGRQLRIRHDDPHLSSYSGTGQQLRCAIELASDVEGLRLVLASTVGERYRLRVADDGSVVELWRR
jgi:hypothetical protein